MERLLIIHSSEVYISVLARQFGSNFHIQVCTDGTQASHQIDRFQPDILILDTGIHRLDALTILQQISHRPGILIALANYMDSRLESRLSNLGVQRILTMPTAASVVTCVHTLMQESAAKHCQSCLEQLAAAHLQKLNFQSHLDGYRQICAGLPLFAKDPHQLMSKELYPVIARELNVTDWRAVEHSIRKSIRTAWGHRNPDIWDQYFPLEADGRSVCPSNKYFLTRLLEKILQGSVKE